jgi:aspartate-semialdehyde dehydrogenase
MLVESEIFKNASIRVTGSYRSAGSTLETSDRKFVVENTENIDVKQNEICVFNTESDVSSQYIPKALNAGAYVIDSSSHYRMQSDVPLVVPYVGKVNISQSKLFAHSKCIVSPLASVISPLHNNFNLQQLIVSTYQSTSGAGRNAMNECFFETKNFCDSAQRNEAKHFPRSIAFNTIPQIGSFDENGFSSEENKIEKELQKIVSKDIYITATCVRVPVLIGHSSSISMKFNTNPNLHEIFSVLKTAKRVELSEKYYTPIEVEGRDKVFVSRVRMNDCKGERWFHMWICSDNLRIGAALDAFEIIKEIAIQI